MIRIIYKTKDIVAILKPSGIPSQSDPTGDMDAMTLTAEELSHLGEASALWLVHRLDRGTSGILVFARTKAAAALLSALIASGNFNKEYLAVCRGVPTPGIYRDLLFKDSLSNKSYVVKTQRRGAKEAELALSLLASTRDNEASLVRLTLYTGRHHQIRAQLSSRGHSLLGDKKYGGMDALCNTPALFAYHVSFSLFGENIDICAMPDFTQYPWRLFEGEVSKID